MAVSDTQNDNAAGIPMKPVTDPANWRAEDLAIADDWIYPLSDVDIAELDAAVAAVEDAGLDISEISEADILKNTQQFLGKIQQQPPIFSALKQNGKRLYEYAREGSKIEIPSRPVTITEFKITKIKITLITRN